MVLTLLFDLCSQCSGSLPLESGGTPCLTNQVKKSWGNRDCLVKVT